MVNLVRGGRAVVDPDHLADHLDDVLEREHAGLPRTGVGNAEAAGHLVAPDLAHIVSAAVEEEAVEQRAGAVRVRGLAGPQPAVRLDQRLSLRDDRVALQRRSDVRVIGIVVHFLEQRQDLLVVGDAERAQERRDGQFALPVDLHGHDVAGARLELQPRAAVGNKFGERHVPPSRRILHPGEVRAGRAHQLAHHHALRPVDHKRPRGRHHREVAEEQRLLLDLARLLHLQLHRDVERRVVGDLFRPALVLGRPGLADVVRVRLPAVDGLGQPRLANVVLAEAQLEPVARRILQRVDLLQRLADAVRQERRERFRLHAHEAGGLHHLARAGVTLDGVGEGAVGAGRKRRHCCFDSPLGGRRKISETRKEADAQGRADLAGAWVTGCGGCAAFGRLTASAGSSRERSIPCGGLSSGCACRRENEVRNLRNLSSFPRRQEPKAARSARSSPT